MKAIVVAVLILQLSLSHFGSSGILDDFIRYFRGEASSGSVTYENDSAPGVQYIDGDIIITVPEGQDTFGG